MPQATQAYPRHRRRATAASRTQLSSDEYLASLSEESLGSSGPLWDEETPALLNRYSCVVEDALLAQAQQTAEMMQQVEALGGQIENAQKVIDAAAEDNAAYHVMLTNPDMLAAYVNDFFGPEGPYPTETAEDRLRADIEANRRSLRTGSGPCPSTPGSCFQAP